ncbi:MAG: AraC family transcriptional regulator [Firmicutes bacterium]|nr:AraC family transcriptional regulator [Bacillota bacterium]
MPIIHHNFYEDDILYFDHATNDSPTLDQYSPHSHTLCEILFFKQGNISYTVDGKRYKLTKNCLVISRPFALHSIEVNGSEPYERFNILYDLSTLPYDMLSKIPDGLDVLSFDGKTSVTGLFDRMDFYCSRLDGIERAQILSHIIEEIFINIAIESDEWISPICQTNEVVAAALKYIDEHLTTLSGIDELCHELYITRSHLHHLFTKHLQISPKKYIISKRIAMAQREIAFGGKPTEVFEQCGFSDYSAFWRAYTAYFGRSPSKKNSPERETVSYDTSPRFLP